jgi:CheY-like chemotaxis protein
MLQNLGYVVTANAATLPDGLKVASEGSFDIAILDINLRGVQSFPIADILLERGIPFLFVTGYAASGATRFCKQLTLQKPFSIKALEQILKQSLTQQAS